MDSKQLHLVKTWLDFANERNGDAYSQFMGLWIAFNVECYALYSTKANRLRADLNAESGLTAMTESTLPIEGLIQKEGERFKIKIEKPGKIAITVSSRYTENIIFDCFA